MNKDIIEVVISLPVNTFTGKDIYNIFLTNLWFKPKKFYGYGITNGDKVFNTKFFEKVKQQKGEVGFSIWDNNDQRFSVVRHVPAHNFQRIHIHCDVTRYSEIFMELEKYVLDNIITMYAAQYYDAYLQRAKNATAYRVKKLEPPKNKLIKNHIGMLEDVDVSNNPGRAIMVSNMWLTSNWRMWFGKEFYNHVDKEHLKKFTKANQIKELQNDILMIELYEGPMQADLPENRAIQQAFRDHIDMEELIKKLK